LPSAARSQAPVDLRMNGRCVEIAVILPGN